LVYPYLFSDISFTDNEIASITHYENIPKTHEGSEIVEAFISVATENAEVESPVQLNVWNGKLNEKEVSITIWENDENARLLGKAARNEIWIKNGNVICRSYNSTEKGGVNTNLTFLAGIANMVASKAEEMSLQGESTNWSKRIRMVRSPSDVNLVIHDKVRYYINSKNKRIDIKGPVFIGVDIKIT